MVAPSAASSASPGVAHDTTLDYEGRPIPVAPGDTVASALYRSGVRVFTRSFKYHRRRSLYCLTGDCPNCRVTVDDESGVRACVTEARPGLRVRREGGLPSVERDVLAVLDRMHWLLPVGFYYKTLLRPRWAWPLAEPWIRRVAGGGIGPSARPAQDREARHIHPDVVVIGAGVAGLSAALAAAEAGRSVVICDEGRIGDKIVPSIDRERVEQLASQVAATNAITLLERTPAVGVYEGPLVVLNEPSLLHLAYPELVIVATGAVDQHGVFPGNDLPGVWLARGAARLAGVHGIAPAQQVVVVGHTRETADHVKALEAAGCEVTTIGDGTVIEARGRKSISSVIIERAGRRERLRCDALVLAQGLVPRANLALQAAGLAVATIGDAASPGLELDAAQEQGTSVGTLGQFTPEAEPPLPEPPKRGIVCLCEDVGVDELEHAWQEGFRSTEILKRYTTATMGVCQGQLCHRHLRAFVAARPGGTGPASGPTTARPPARRITLEQAAAGVREEVHQRTSLHARHLEHGATMEPMGIWRRPKRYGDPIDEYWAVRRGVSVMDVGTLGKFLIAGADATEFLERLYPCRVADLDPGRARYALLLDEHGFVIDDGMVCALGEGRWYLTFTSAGAETVEATLKDWADTWAHDVHIVDLTTGRGAINVAGPSSRKLLESVTTGPLHAEAFPYLQHREITVAGVPCRAIRLGFVGELSFELHHESNRSVELWDALLEAGASLGARPHGLDALRLLRLEKGHIMVGQDTDFDATPAKLNMSWAVGRDKGWFVGKRGLERAAKFEPQRRLVALSFAGQAPAEGASLRAGGENVGYISSSGWSPVLECGVSLGWVTRTNGSFPDELESDGVVGRVVDHAFYDPKGERLRA
jgi:sarcosine oxidase subunit alpha